MSTFNSNDIDVSHKTYLDQILEEIKTKIEYKDDDESNENNETETDKEDNEERIVLGGKEYVFRNNNLFLVKKAKDKNGNVIESLQELGPAIYITAVISKPNNKKIYEIEYHDEKLLTDNIDLKELENLIGKYVLDTTKYKMYINHSVDIAPKKKIVTCTGWNEDLSQFYHPAVTYNNIIYDIRNQEDFRGSNTEQQHQFVKEQLEQGKMLGLLYVISTSNLFLVEKTKPALTVVSGVAKAGKTLSCSLACNLFYNSNDILITANATHVALELTMRNMKNLPLLVDEGALKTFDLENLVFMVSSQRGRARGTKELKVNISNLNNQVFLTSEILEPDEAKRAGAARRLLDFVASNWSDFSDTDQKTAVKMLGNYGAGVDYIQKLLADNSLQKYTNLAEKESAPTGMEQVFTPLWAAFFFLESFYNLKFKALADKLLRLVEQKQIEIEQKTDTVMQFKDKFTQFVVKNARNFITSTEDTPKTEVWGKTEGNSTFILTSVFDQFCTEHGFNKKVLLTELQKEKILSAPPGQKAKPIRFFNKVCPCYHIVI